ncbi:hypothetical protein ACFPIJ_27585 [Dactylosporangium cerinum]|uniref:CopG family transcriptional regulator n=1 Tax=Dactylosporangium cerinum TaxID=1434730 RepID=A0ABV9W216_9ACTN
MSKIKRCKCKRKRGCRCGCPPGWVWLTIELEDDLHAQCTRIAEREGVALSTWLSYAVQSYVTREQRRETDAAARLEADAAARREAAADARLMQTINEIRGAVREIKAVFEAAGSPITPPADAGEDAPGRR